MQHQCTTPEHPKPSLPDTRAPRKDESRSPQSRTHPGQTAPPRVFAEGSSVFSQPADTTPSAPQQDPRAFLEHFPQTRRSAIANWFHFAVREGAQTPSAVCRAVGQRVQGTLDWCSLPETQAHLQRVLEIMRTDQAGTLAYAGYVIDYEHLPYAERQKIKGRRALTFVMQGKPTTAKQEWLLRSIGYTGDIPHDRAAASALLDQLLRKARGHNDTHP